MGFWLRALASLLWRFGSLFKTGLEIVIKGALRIPSDMTKAEID